MNGGVQDFVARMVETYPLGGRVLEVGSLDVCGSARRWFTKDGQQLEPTERFPEYIGIDIVPGNLVDRIMNAHHLEFDDQSFDVVISTSSLEHDDEFWVSMKEIGRVLKPGGYFIVSVPGYAGCAPHCVHDYWRFLPEGVDRLLELAGLTLIERTEVDNDLLAFAIKL